MPPSRTPDASYNSCQPDDRGNRNCVALHWWHGVALSKVLALAHVDAVMGRVGSAVVGLVCAFHMAMNNVTGKVWEEMVLTRNAAAAQRHGGVDVEL